MASVPKPKPTCHLLSTIIGFGPAESMIQFCPLSPSYSRVQTALSFQPSALSFPRREAIQRHCDGRNCRECPAHCLRPTACLLSNGGFVPDFPRRRSFVFIQIGGFVFSKGSQPSVISHQLSTSTTLGNTDCLLPTAYCLLLTAF